MISLKNKLLNHSKSQLQLSTPQLDQQQQQQQHHHLNQPNQQHQFSQKLKESLKTNENNNENTNINDLDSLHKKFDLFVSAAAAASTSNNNSKPPLCKQTTAMIHSGQLNNKLSMSSISLSISPELSELSGTSSTHDQVTAANNRSNKENMQQSFKQCKSQPYSHVPQSSKPPVQFQEQQQQQQQQIEQRQNSFQSQSNGKQSAHQSIEDTSAAAPVVVKYGELIVLGLELKLKRKIFFCVYILLLFLYYI
jgi:hypothetical protein